MNKVIIVYGLPCTGKSTVCGFLSERLSAAQVYTDKVWKEVFPDPKYTADESHTVFATILNKVETRMRENVPAILVEGVFASVERMQALKSLAISSGYNFHSILLFADTEVLKSRNHARNEEKENQMPDNVIDKLKGRFTSWDFCDISINTGLIAEKKTNLITAQLV